MSAKGQVRREPAAVAVAAAPRSTAMSNSRALTPPSRATPAVIRCRSTSNRRGTQGTIVGRTSARLAESVSTPSA
jgi:hypothetical protein